MKIHGSNALESVGYGAPPPDPKVAAKEFEAFLISEVWKHGQRGHRWSKLLGDGSASRMTNEMWIDEVVRQGIIDQGRSLGLAEQLGKSQEKGS